MALEWKDLIKKIRTIEIKSRRASENELAGNYHSAFKGRGMAFSEVRAYQFGDDVRHIDWNVTARQSQTYVKVFEEERQLQVLLMLDLSASNLLEHEEGSKREKMAEIAAMIAFSAIKNQDRVALLLFTDKDELFIPPNQGRAHILRMIKEIITFKPSKARTNIASGMSFIQRVIKHKSVCFLLSDFNAAYDAKSLKFTCLKHDLIGIHVFDESELNLANLGFIPIKDAETGYEYWLDTDDEAQYKEFQKANHKMVDSWKKGFKQYGASWIELNLEEDYFKKIWLFFKKRANH